jgi:acetyltransferase
LDKLFSPDSIAIVGISPRKGNLGRGVLDNLREYGYRGRVHLVGRGGGTYDGLPVQTSVADLPDGIDLAVILTPAATVPGYLEACGRRGIRRACIESAGFDEFSDEGAALQARLIEIARRWEIHFTGPNGLGVVNLPEGVCAPFSPMLRNWIRPGRISVVAQSGGLIHHAGFLLTAAGMGMNKGVSLGNKVDLNENDFLAHLLEDDTTDAIWLYLEGIADGRRLLELARAARKPLLMIKAGRGGASREILRSHTAALAGDDRVVSAAARQANIVRAGNFAELINLTKAFALPPVAGRDLLIFARSGGRAVMAADAAEAHGFRLAAVPPSFLEEVRRHNRADVIRPTNPVDLGAMYDEEAWVHLLEEGVESLRPHAALMSYIYTPAWEARSAGQVAADLRDLARRINLPLAVVPSARADVVGDLERDLGYPVFGEVEDAIRALAASRDWHARANRLRREVPFVASAEGHRDAPCRSTSLDGALRLLEAHGVQTAPWVVAWSVEDAVEAGKRLGYPLALKVISPEISHKSNVGGVALNVADEAALRHRWTAMEASIRTRAPGATVHGMLVQKMIFGGQEMIVGGRRDASFGPVVLFGLGGIYVEALDDVSLRVAPLTRFDAEEMIDEVQGSRLLRGLRGEAPADRGALVDALLAVSRLMMARPEIQELDVNPLLVLEKGALALDARIGLK